MMALPTTEHLQQVTAGRWIRPPQSSMDLTGLSIDSRNMKPGQVFLALAGEHFDGHDFLQAAETGGAVALIGSDVAKLQQCKQPALLVSDTLTALHDLARARREHLKRSGTKVIAVAGSNGKTTTRHLIHCVLSARYRGTQSPKNFNNHIGVPLTLLAASPEDDFVVVEVGTNHPGEIANLAGLVRPDAAVVTSIGIEHLAFFGDLEAIAREEASVASFVQPDGIFAVSQPAFEQIHRHLSLPKGVRLIRYGQANPHRCPELAADELNRRDDGCSWRLDTTWFNLPILGRHNVFNGLAAVAVGRWMAMEDGIMAAALSRARPLPMRLEVTRLGSATGSVQIVLINDAYNANPDSMREALEALACFPLAADGGRRVAVLGDMLELGPGSDRLHRQVGRWLLDQLFGDAMGSIDVVIAIGELAGAVVEPLQGRWSKGVVHRFGCWSDATASDVADLVRPGDVVLLKASRGAALERIVPALIARAVSIRI